MRRTRREARRPMDVSATSPASCRRRRLPARRRARSAFLAAAERNRLARRSAALYVVAIAAAGACGFDVGAGFTVPTQARVRPDALRAAAAARAAAGLLALSLGMAPDMRARAAGRRAACCSSPATAGSRSGPRVVLVVADDARARSAGAAILLAALAAQFACDFVASAVRERLRGGTRSASCVEEIGQRLPAIDLALAPVGLAVAFARRRDSQLAGAADRAAVRRARASSRASAARASSSSSSSTTPTAAPRCCSATSSRPTTPTPASTPQGVVAALARGRRASWGSTRDRARNVEFGALLHDVGKIAVPEGDHQQARPARRRRVGDHARRHTIEGQRMLDRVGGFMREVGAIVRASHERWDGSGYPDGLARRGDPARGAHRLRLRRLQRDDDRPLLPRGDAVARPRSPSCALNAGHAVRPEGRRRADAHDPPRGGRGRALGDRGCRLRAELPEPVAQRLLVFPLTWPGEIRVQAMRLVTFRDRPHSTRVGELDGERVYELRRRRCSTGSPARAASARAATTPLADVAPPGAGPRAARASATSSPSRATSPPGGGCAAARSRRPGTTRRSSTSPTRRRSAGPASRSRARRDATCSTSSWRSRR